MEDLGKRVKSLRKKANISANKLSYILNISQSNLNRIENNAVVPSIEAIKKLCDFFNIPIDFLVYGKNPSEYLPEDEKKLLKGYQQLTERRKGALEDKLKDLLKDQETESQQEEVTKQEIS